MSEQEITLEDLARMVKGGFDAVDKRFDAVDERFEAIDKRFEAIDKRFEAVDKRFDKIEERLERIEVLHLTDHRKRIERLEDELKTVKLKLAIA